MTKVESNDSNQSNKFIYVSHKSNNRVSHDIKNTIAPSNLGKPYSPRERGYANQEKVDEQLSIIFNDYQEYDGSAFYEREHQDGRTGADLWNAMALAQAYKDRMTKNEENLFSDNRKELRPIFEGDSRNILDVGVGTRGKFFDLMKAGGFNIREKDYIGIDVSGRCLDIAEQYAKNKVHGIVKSKDDRANSKVYKDNKGAIIWSGGSVGNNTDHLNHEVFKAMSSGGARNIAVTHFIAPVGDNRKEKIAQIEHMYRTPEMENRILTGFESLGIPRRALEFHASYIEGTEGKTDMMTIGAYLTEDLEMRVHGRKIIKKAGTFLQAINSRRYTTEQFAKLAKDAGCKHKKTFEKDGVAVTILRTPRTPLIDVLKDKAKTTRGKISLALLGALTMGYGGMKVEKYVQEIKHQRLVEEVRNERVADRGSDMIYSYNSAENAIDAQNDVIDEFLAAFEYIYKANLSKQQKIYLKDILIDWLRMSGESTINRRAYAHQMMYDPSIFQPRDIEKFIFDNKTKLIGLKIPIVAQPHLIRHMTEIRNTYLYKGPKLVFEDVDIQLDPYVNPTLGENSEGEYTTWEYPAGIKIVNNVPYMVFYHYSGKGYVLEERGDNPIDLDYSVQKFVVDLIKQGEVNLLAEQIRTYLLLKSGESAVYNNGQNVIVRYLTDLYAKGMNLSYLIGKPYQEYYTERPLLEIFIQSYVIPDIGNELKNSDGVFDTKMYALDPEKIMVGAEADVRALTHSVTAFAKKYAYSNKLLNLTEGEMESAILRKIMYDRAWKFISNERDMRCWIDENIDFFKDLGFNLIKFHNPFPDTTGIGGPSEETILKRTLSEPDLNCRAEYGRHEFYKLMNGDVINLANTMGAKSNEFYLAGRRMPNDMVRDSIQVKIDSIKAELLKKYVRLDETFMMDEKLVKWQGEFNTYYTKKVYEDYNLRVKAREEYKKKKK